MISRKPDCIDAYSDNEEDLIKEIRQHINRLKQNSSGAKADVFASRLDKSSSDGPEENQLALLEALRTQLVYAVENIE